MYREDMKKIVIISLTALVFIALVLGGLYLTGLVGEKASKTKEADSSLWEVAIAQMSDSWDGRIPLDDPHLLKNCPHMKVEEKIPAELKACRSEIFHCYYQGRVERLKFKKKWYDLVVTFPTSSKNSFYTLESPAQAAYFRGSHFELPITLKVGPEVRHFSLTDTCRQVTLPKGMYWGNAKRKKEERVWHTSGLSYRVDRFLVRGLDIREWALHHEWSFSTELKEKIMSLKGKNLFKPITGLMPEVMERFCVFRGGSVLSSRLKAALTYHHGRESKKIIGSAPPSFNTSSHPFGPRESDSLRYQVLNEEKKITKDVCKQYYVRECRKHSWLELFPFGMGWLGVSELMGGPMEYVVNKAHPRKNIHPSSYYFPLKSEVHKAATRINWNGQGSRTVDFNFFTYPLEEAAPHKELDVSFRCMSKSLEEEP